jgi:uncharacterized protein (TIGR02145 family)
MKIEFDSLSLWQISIIGIMANLVIPRTFIIFLTGLLFLFGTSCNRFKQEKAVVTDLISPTPAVVEDRDGNVYHTVTIGTQVWMVENLRTTRYDNGEAIPMVKDDSQWNKLTTGAFCNYENDASYGSTYGHLYNFYTTLDTRNLCPAGWHVPTDEDWDILSSFLGGDLIAAGKMKDTKASSWDPPNFGATNESGFTALAGGYRSIKGTFHSLGSYTFLWSSTAYAPETGWCRYFQNGSDRMDRIDNYKAFGFSVRCVKDK